MDSMIYTVLAVVSTLLGLFVGAWARRKSLMVVQFNDPFTWMLIIFVFAVLLMPYINPDWAYIDPYNLDQDICLMGFFGAYFYGYLKEECLTMYVSAHNIFKLEQIIKPIAYYYNDDNQLCWQPQQMRYVIKRMLFNVDNPADFSVELSRTRYIEFQGKFIKQSAHCVDTAAMEIKTITVEKGHIGRWHIKFKALALHFDPSPLNTYDIYDFYVEGRIADEYVQNYQRLKIENANAAADLRMARVLGAVKIVQSISSMTPDQVVMDRITGDLDRRNGTTLEDVERANRVGEVDGETKARNGERRRRNMAEEDGE